MDLRPDFAFKPTTPVLTYPPPSPSPPGPPAPPPPAPAPDLGALQGLVGAWHGSGFNTIWRPNHGDGGDHFLELNLTAEDLEFDVIPGEIPNRGLLQGDLLMAGLRYLQQVQDSNLNQGLHIEPGVWLAVPPTTDPLIPVSVARLGSIPHGTTILAQGVASTVSGGPTIPPASITPFQIGKPTSTVAFPEQTLTNQTPATRTQPPGANNISQAMLDNPNSVLAAALAGKAIAATTSLVISTDGTTPIIGGGTANTAFLQGGPDGPNADAQRMDAIFWLLTQNGQSDPDLLLYSQTVLLNFNGLSWPHVTVGALNKQVAGS